jgi:ketosteroid isomerase-like protein
MLGGTARLAEEDDMATGDRSELARQSYLAYANGDRDFYEELLAPEFRFSSPPDPDLDRDGFFARCWPGAGKQSEFHFVRVIESGDEVVVTYETRRADGTGGRNTEVLTFDEAGEKLVRTEVYFGWSLT